MRLSKSLILAAFLVCFIFAGSHSVAGEQPVRASGNDFSFTDVTKKAKINTKPIDGGHGVAFADVDNDGDLDIFVTNTYGPTLNKNYLFINQGNGVFKEQAKKLGVSGEDLGSHGVVFADLDNDGDLDLLVGNAGAAGAPGQNRLYINDGSGNFADNTENAGMLGSEYFTRGIAAADFNGDGWVDFVITNPWSSSTWPESALSIPRFYLNRGSWPLKLKTAGLKYTGFTQGIAVADVDNDGDLDLIESKYPNNNFGGAGNTLWLNNGRGKFRDDSDSVGDNFSKDGNFYNGAAFGDSDNDGDLDMIVLGKQLRFFINDGKGSFTEEAGSGLSGSGYTAAFGDLNHDGRLDVVVADNSVAESFVVFKNVGGNRFQKQADVGAAPPSFNDPRGLALGDYDSDGDLDIVVVHKKGIAQLFRNDCNTQGFIKLRLGAPSGEAGAIGAKVWIYQQGKSGQAGALLAYRQVGSSTGYISQNSPDVHIGLKKAKRKVDIVVRFLDGLSISLAGVSPGKTITLGFN